MVQTTVGSTLVAGTIGAISDTTMRVKAIRSFLYRGAAVPVGTELELSRHFALELIAVNKAEVVEAPSDIPATIDADEEAEVSRPRRGRPPKPKE